MLVYISAEIEPIVCAMATLNDNLEWTYQFGYAVADQQAGVMDSR
jgi:hypothetical protein